MYTICCCSGSSHSNVGPSPSLSQLNSSIEIFSQLPIFSVGSTCSSSCFCFSIVLTGLFVIFSGSSRCSFSTKLSADSQHIIADSILSSLIVDSFLTVFNSAAFLFISVVFRSVLTFLNCAFFSFRNRVGSAPINTT